MATRVLCAGDIHIGKRSSRVSDIFRSADAWRDIVQLALELDVDMVALSGDIIDNASNSYEALGPMRHELARLSEAKITTVAVAGNHDFEVLERLSSITGNEHFRLLGTNGKWERFTLVREGAPVLHIDGWSFPSEHVWLNPLDSYPQQPADNVPVMALLHADISAGNSSYAPIRAQELWTKPFLFTLLGHIHKPQMIEGPQGKLVLYPGSPYALDPGEPGIHGCWLAEIDDHGSVSLRQYPLSPVQYVSDEIDMDGVLDESGFQRRLTEALTRLARQTANDFGSQSLQVVSARLVCIGTSPVHRRIDGWIDQALSDLGRFEVGSVHVEVDKLSSTVRPAINLNERSKGNDPVGETARLILALREDPLPEPYDQLVSSTLGKMQDVYMHTGYAALRTADDDLGPQKPDALILLEQQAWEILSSLVSQEKQS